MFLLQTCSQKSHVGQGCVPFWSLWWESFPCSFTSTWLQDWSLSFFAGCQLGTTVTSRQPPSGPYPCPPTSQDLWILVMLPSFWFSAAKASSWIVRTHGIRLVPPGSSRIISSSEGFNLNHTCKVPVARQGNIFTGVDIFGGHYSAYHSTLAPNRDFLLGRIREGRRERRKKKEGRKKGRKGGREGAVCRVSLYNL